MPTFNLGFAAKLIDSADAIQRAQDESEAGQRVVLYLALTAAEIAMKAFLEAAEVRLDVIRGLSHSHRKLVEAICKCEIKTGPSNVPHNWKPASSICAASIEIGGARTTVGTVFTAEYPAVSSYPNEVRYGDDPLRHYPTQAVLEAARRLVEWAKDNLSIARVKAEFRSDLVYGDGDSRAFRRRNIESVIRHFCKVYGGGVKLGKTFGLYSEGDDDEDDDDAYDDVGIGYWLIDFHGKKCGRVSAEYSGPLGVHARVRVHGEELKSIYLPRARRSETSKDRIPLDLKDAIVDVVERSLIALRQRRGD